MTYSLKYYPKKEEIVNVITHAIGFLLSIAALVLLIVQACMYGSVWHIVAFSIYGSSLAILYLASTAYHGAKRKKLRWRLNILDHIAIYLLIAGTYTPFALVTLRGPWGWSIFGIVWGLALLGTVFKLFLFGKYDKLSTLAYVLMGWVIIIAIKPLAEVFPNGGLWWLFAGGISYSLGAIFYIKERIPYSHAMFHGLVLGGSFCHFWAIYFYMI